MLIWYLCGCTYPYEALTKVMPMLSNPFAFRIFTYVAKANNCSRQHQQTTFKKKLWLYYPSGTQNVQKVIWTFPKSKYKCFYLISARILKWNLPILITNKLCTEKMRTNCPWPGWEQCDMGLLKCKCFSCLSNLVFRDLVTHMTNLFFANMKWLISLPMTMHFSRDMRFPTMWYVRQAKAQISLRIRWSEPLLVAWIFCDCLATDWTAFGVS